MLFSIRAQGQNAANLSWLLHKRSDRFQSFNMGYGSAHVFFPDAADEDQEACLFLEGDPQKLNSVFKAKAGMLLYADERQFISSSLLTTAISRVYESALKGKYVDKPEALCQTLHLQAKITNFPCRINTSYIQKIFEPLGYEICWNRCALDESLQEFGSCQHGDLTIKNVTTLKNLLVQLYILIPVFAGIPYYRGDEHMESFKKYSASWLYAHPKKYFIIK